MSLLAPQLFLLFFGYDTLLEGHPLKRISQFHKQVRDSFVGLFSLAHLSFVGLFSYISDPLRQISADFS